MAGLKRYILDNQLVNSGKKFAVVVSGANMNFDRLRFVAERAALGEGREALLSVDIPERPGRYATHPPHVIAPRLNRDTMSCPRQLFRAPYGHTPSPGDRVHIQVQCSRPCACLPLIPVGVLLPREGGRERA